MEDLTLSILAISTYRNEGLRSVRRGDSATLFSKHIIQQKIRSFTEYRWWYVRIQAPLCLQNYLKSIFILWFILWMAQANKQKNELLRFLHLSSKKEIVMQEIIFNLILFCVLPCLVAFNTISILCIFHIFIFAFLPGVVCRLVDGKREKGIQDWNTITGTRFGNWKQDFLNITMFVFKTSCRTRHKHAKNWHHGILLAFLDRMITYIPIPQGNVISISFFHKRSHFFSYPMCLVCFSG